MALLLNSLYLPEDLAARRNTSNDEGRLLLLRLTIPTKEGVGKYLPSGGN